MVDPVRCGMDNKNSDAAQKRWRLRSIGLVAALGLLGAACGSTAADTTASATSAPAVAAAESTDASEAIGPEVDETPTEAAVPDDLSKYPNITVTDVATGGDVELAGLIASSDRPVLLWFWAPH